MLFFSMTLSALSTDNILPEDKSNLLILNFSHIIYMTSQKDGILDKAGDKCMIFHLGHHELIPWFSGLRASDLTLPIIII